MDSEYLNRLKAARAKIARMVMADPTNKAYVQHFRWAEAEIAEAEADDVMARVQNAIA